MAAVRTESDACDAGLYRLLRQSAAFGIVNLMVLEANSNQERRTGGEPAAKTGEGNEEAPQTRGLRASAGYKGRISILYLL